MSAPVRLVYIASCSHSGSTLLDLLLNAHSRFASVGELKKFPARITAGETYRCTCGELPLEGCSFWPGVVDRLAGSTDELALFGAIGMETNGAIIVDSSKVPRWLSRLLKSPEVDVLPVFLVRDPRGQVCSTLRKGEATLIRAIRDYNRINRKIMRTLRQRAHVLIRYEDLVVDPRGAIEPILSLCGEAFEAGQLDWASAEKHSLAGNRMRHGSDSGIRRDERWRTELTVWQKLAIQAGTSWTRLAIAAHIAQHHRRSEALASRTLANSDSVRHFGHSRLFARRAPIA